MALQLFKKKEQIFFILICITFDFSSLENVIKLPNGLISGRKDTTMTGNFYYAFEKIPYAAPPIGNLRFQAPRPVENWSGILNTTKLDTICYQLEHKSMLPTEEIESEDCLFLNVFTPELPLSANKLLPVVVHVFGGRYIFGKGKTLPDLFINENVVLVTLNHRIGIFGFISTEDSTIPGNMGLKDQLLALKWINKNIRFFGGNPKKITVFGESSGATSLATIALSNNSLNLFRGMILVSGTFLGPSMFQRNPRKLAFKTAALINSTFQKNNDSDELLRFLQNVDADVLNQAANESANTARSPLEDFLEVRIPFAPVIEPDNPDAIITQKQYFLLKSGNIVKVPTIMGINSEEKLGTEIYLLKKFANILDEHTEYLLPHHIEIPKEHNRTKLGNYIRNIYTKGNTFRNRLESLVRFSSDNFLIRPQIRHAEIYSQFAPTYFYQISYKTSLQDHCFAIDGTENVPHGAQAEYFFCSGRNCYRDYSAEDLLTRQRIITLWTNFVKYLNPTPEPMEVLQNISWPTVSTSRGNFLYLDINTNLTVKNRLRGEEYAKWVALFNRIGTDNFESF